MKLPAKSLFLEKLSTYPPALLKRPKLNELIRLYSDLEKTLRGLSKSAEQAVVAESIHVGKLIQKLSYSKKRLERKIGNVLLLEKENLQRKVHQFLKNSQ